jgi:hypothetical protein
MTDDRLGVEKAEPKPSEAVPNEDKLRTERAYREQTGPDEDRHDTMSQATSPAEERKKPAGKNEDDIDEAIDESFPASDPPSYSKGLPKTG